MSSQLSCGLVGLPNAGKSTLFNCLTDNNALVANYPFATIEPNVGIVEVRDDRLSHLAKLYNSPKIVPAALSVTDIAGLVSGASQGEGLGNQFLSHIRSCQAIVEVVRAFDDPDIAHVEQDHDPEKDINIINTELILADLQTLERRLAKMQKEAKSDPKLKPVLDQYQEAYKLLDSGKPLWTLGSNLEHLAELQLLTLKPIIYVFNLGENDLANQSLKNRLAKLVEPTPALFICAKLEAELNGLDDVDRQDLLLSYGQKETGLAQLIDSLYDLLKLQSYLTAGPKEVRAWTIKQGSSAPQAAGVIHSDFERGFIAAEVVRYQDLIDAGSLANARANGKVRTEGKTYIVHNDDVIEFRFNVSKP